jgi:hypothetical protein
MNESESNSNNNSSLVVVVIIAIILAVLVWYFAFTKEPESAVVPEEVPAVVENTELEQPETVPTETLPDLPDVTAAPESATEAVEEVKNPLPNLDESDAFIQTKLAELTWRKELLKLVINEDMVRRLVVFTDNFAKGIVAYKHSPLVKPASTFSAIETDKIDEKYQKVFQWDENASRRFSLYVDLLRSFDSDSLVQWYIESKPLIDQAYAELGYPDQDFTDVLQQAITRVLDMEIPKQPLEIIRPSVMYQYKDKNIEAKDEADKLLLRLGKENLLVIKSVLLELSEKLSRAENG